jgi:amino acid transporter
METLLDFLLTFAVLGGMAFLVAQMSKDREIGFWTLFVVSVFLTPFVGIFVALLSKRKRGAGSGVNVQSESIKETQSKFWERFTPKKDGN